MQLGHLPDPGTEPVSASVERDNDTVLRLRIMYVSGLGKPHYIIGVQDGNQAARKGFICFSLFGCGLPQ